MNIFSRGAAKEKRAAGLQGRGNWRRAFAGAAMFSLSLATLSAGQQSAKERKIVTRVEPDYPPVLKVRQIGGTVRLDVTITPKGTVKSVSVVGGNPVLADSAIAAVKQWVYAPGDAVTIEHVAVEFNPYR